MKENYARFVDRMIDKYEGGYGWDRNDPGGPTKYGITCYDLAKNRGQKMDSMSRWAPIVKAMTLSEAEDIYHKKYAKAVRFDELPSGVDCVMMDYGVNSGTSRPILVAHRLLKVPGTGFTDELLAAIRRASPIWFIQTMNAERISFMKQIRNGRAWGQNPGWAVRVADLTRYATSVATKTATPTASAVPPSAKATPEDVNVGTKAGSGAGAVVGAGGLAVATGFPWWAVAVAVAVGLIAVGLYVSWKKRQESDVAEAVIVPTGV